MKRCCISRLLAAPFLFMGAGLSMADIGVSGDPAHPLEGRSGGSKPSAALVERSSAGFSISWDDFAEGEYRRTGFSSGYIFQGDWVVAENRIGSGPDRSSADTTHRGGVRPWLSVDAQVRARDSEWVVTGEVFPGIWHDPLSPLGFFGHLPSQLSGGLSYPLSPEFWLSVSGGIQELSDDRPVVLSAADGWRRFANGIHLSYDPSPDQRHLFSAGLAWESVSLSYAPRLVGSAEWARTVREQVMLASLSWQWRVAQGITFRPELSYRFSHQTDGVLPGPWGGEKGTRDVFTIGATVSARF